MTEDKRKLIEDLSSCMKLLDNAIDMHQMHLDDPGTATPLSQYEMMILMLSTKNCILSQLILFGK